MATYVISDIHGNLEVFKKLLKLIDFKYTGEDTLFLLGDYVDWGPEPLKSLLYVMELSKKYDFIHPLLGNHDLMFIEQIDLLKQEVPEIYTNWVYYNGGAGTFEQYKKESKESQQEIEKFLKELPYVAETIVNNKKYIMAHACPVKEYVYDNNYSPEENEDALWNAKQTATWTRITRKCMNVINWFDRENKYGYECFICGHTITENYDFDAGHMKIINKPNNYIDIDCGAKILGHSNFTESDYARLAALRLDDLEEFYADIDKVC